MSVHMMIVEGRPDSLGIDWRAARNFGVFATNIEALMMQDSLYRLTPPIASFPDFYGPVYSSNGAYPRMPGF